MSDTTIKAERQDAAASPDRRLTDLLRIEHPLVLAPMAGLGTVELAASVCAAGGLGSLGCAAGDRAAARPDQRADQRQLLLP